LVVGYENVGGDHSLKVTGVRGPGPGACVPMGCPAEK
jgi:hypothetical protein